MRDVTCNNNVTRNNARACCTETYIVNTCHNVYARLRAITHVCMKGHTMFTCMECVAEMHIHTDDVEYMKMMDPQQTMIIDAGMIVDTRESRNDDRPLDGSHIHGYCNNCYVGE